MKVQEVILRAMAKKITWWQAAEIIGISVRNMQPEASSATRSKAMTGCSIGGGEAQHPAGADGDGRRGAAAVSGEVLGFERTCTFTRSCGKDTRSSSATRG